MTEPDPRASRPREAAAGALVTFAMVWLAVVGLHLYWRNWEEAAFWAAIAVATMAASWAGLPGFRPRR